MLSLVNFTVKLSDNGKEILSDISYNFESSKVYLVRGANGSGKSTLASAIAGRPGLEVSGEVRMIDEGYSEHIWEKINKSGDLKMSDFRVDQLDATGKALAGIFLANQYPLEIPGLNLSNFLRLAYNQFQPEPVSVPKFRKLLKQAAEMINFPENLLDRNLNEGFSGGEKKKTEILQMCLLKPRYAILDETDSGLDKKAIADVFAGIAELKKQNPDMTIILITHYDKVLEFLRPDVELEMVSGRLKVV